MKHPSPAVHPAERDDEPAVRRLERQAEEAGIRLTPGMAEGLARGNARMIAYVADLIALRGLKPAVQPRYDGGPVEPGQTYTMNENGPEALVGRDGSVSTPGNGSPVTIMPRQPGTVLPNAASLSSTSTPQAPAPKPASQSSTGSVATDQVATYANVSRGAGMNGQLWPQSGAVTLPAPGQGNPFAPNPNLDPMAALSLPGLPVPHLPQSQPSQPATLLPRDEFGGIEGLDAPPPARAFDQFGSPVVPNIHDFVMQHPDYKPDHYTKVWSDDGRYTKPGKDGTADPDPGELHDGSMIAYAPEGAVDPVTKKPLQPIEPLSDGSSTMTRTNPKTGKEEAIIDPETGKAKTDYYAMVTERGAPNHPLLLPSGFYRSKTALRKGSEGNPRADLAPDAFPDSEAERLLAWPYYNTVQTVMGKGGRAEDQRREDQPIRGQMGDLGYVVNNNTGQHYPALAGDVRHNPRPEVSEKLYQEMHPRPLPGAKRQPLPPGPRFTQYVFQGSGDGPLSWDPALAEERYALADRAALHNPAVQEAISAGYHRYCQAHPNMHGLPPEDAEAMGLDADVNALRQPGISRDPSSSPDWQVRVAPAPPNPYVGTGLKPLPESRFYDPAARAGGGGPAAPQPWPGQAASQSRSQGAEQIPPRAGYERILGDGRTSAPFAASAPQVPPRQSPASRSLPAAAATPRGMAPAQASQPPPHLNWLQRRFSRHP